MGGILLFLLPVSVASCDNISPEVKGPAGSGDTGCETKFRIEVSGATDSFGVKSILTEETIEDKLTELTFAAYDGNGLLVDVKSCGADHSSLSLDFGASPRCNVYVLANMGDMTDDFPVHEADVASMEYIISSYDEIEEAGFPMAGMKSIRSGSMDGIIYLDRLFAKVNVTIRHFGLEGYSEDDLYVHNMCNRSIHVRQANSRLRPFASGGSRAEGVEDIMDESDYNPDLNDRWAYEGSLSQGELGYGPGYFQDTTIVLYVPENIHGNLLPTDGSPQDKIYDNIQNIGELPYGDVCTYLEFNAFREREQGYSGSVMYRYYLGADNVADFSIVRNCSYNLILDFTENGFFDDSWKVTRGDDWIDYRCLRFLSDTYRVRPGGTVNVMIHFHRNTDAEIDSEPYPDRWEYEVDGWEMSQAGLTEYFDPDNLVTGPNGCRDFCLEIKASEDAVVNSEVEVFIRTSDGGNEKKATIKVVQENAFEADWDFCPEYVTQYGILTVSGYEDSDLPLELSVSDESKLSFRREPGGDAFKIVAYDTGQASVTVSNADGTKSVSVGLDIAAPVLSLGSSRIELNPDGGKESISYEYLTAVGGPLEHFDDVAFSSVLKLCPLNSGYFETEMFENTANVYISRLNDDGSRIVTGGVYYLDMAPVDCGDVIPETLAVKVIDPFEDVVPEHFGMIEDYTLFGLQGVNPELESEFSDEIERNSVFEFDVRLPNCDPDCISAELVPRWSGNFSYANGVYDLDIDAGSGLVTITQGAVGHSTKHSAGLHDVMLSVMNRHSGETLENSCGTMDVYVHAAIGAEARFGSQQCCAPGGNGTFADIYNSIADVPVYPSPQSTDYIHYMDVTMKFITSVTGVSVFEKLRSRQAVYDARDFLLPSREDGEIYEKMLFSVSGADGRPESGTPRDGLGVPLYRALLIRTFDYRQSEINLYKLFFGYEAGVAGGPLAPAYTLYDCGEASFDVPYHFTPSIFNNENNEYKEICRDKDGKGYHIIHFLEEIVPETCGWINLLQL